MFKRGVYWMADELVENSGTIILAVLTETEIVNPVTTIYRLKPIDVLKGDSPEVFEFHSYSNQHYANDFGDHTDADFWKENTGRSPWPCCICGPDHTFVQGETYLVFPDAFGAMKSAEIVQRPHDKWLVYVQESLY